MKKAIPTIIISAIILTICIASFAAICKQMNDEDASEKYRSGEKSVINTDTFVVHKISCSHLPSPKNRFYFSIDPTDDEFIDELIDSDIELNYDLDISYCKFCLPQKY